MGRKFYKVKRVAEFFGKFPGRNSDDPLEYVTMQLPKTLLEDLNKICVKYDIPRQRLVAALLRKCINSPIQIDLEKDT